MGHRRPGDSYSKYRAPHVLALSPPSHRPPPFVKRYTNKRQAMVTRRMAGGNSPRKALGPDRRRTCIPETRLSDRGSGIVFQGYALWGRRQSRGHLSTQATTYTRRRNEAARIFDKLVVIARPYGTQAQTVDPCGKVVRT